MPTEIYIDVLFFVNFTADYFLLLGTARMMHHPIKRLRLVMAAAVGALYAVLIFFPFFLWGVSFLIKAGVSVAMVLTGFGYPGKRAFFKLLFCFYFISFLFGGTVEGLSAFTGIGAAVGLKISNGAVYLNLPVWLLIGYILLCYALLLIYSRIAIKRAEVGEGLYRVEIYLGDRKTEFAAMADSGNLLTSLSGEKPVMIAAGEAVGPLFKEALPAVLTGDLDKEIPPVLMGKFFLIPYQSLGTSNGLLPAFCPDRFVIRRGNFREELTGILVGVSPTRLSSDGQFQGLLHQDMTKTIKEAVKHGEKLDVAAKVLEKFL